jgi:hypothetical protein
METTFRRAAQQDEEKFESPARRRNMFKFTQFRFIDGGINSALKVEVSSVHINS